LVCDKKNNRPNKNEVNLLATPSDNQVCVALYFDGAEKINLLIKSKYN